MIDDLRTEALLEVVAGGTDQAQQSTAKVIRLVLFLDAYRVKKVLLGPSPTLGLTITT